MNVSFRARIVATAAGLSLASAPTGAQVSPEQAQLSPEKVDSLARRSTFDNGFRIALIPRTLFPDEAEARLLLRMGSPEATAGRAWEARFAGRLIEAGSTTRSGAAMQAELARLGVRVQFTGRTDGVLVAFSGKGSGLLPALRIVYDALRNPAYPDSALTAMRATELQRLAAGRTNTSMAARIAFDRRLMPWPDEHPYATTTIAHDSAQIVAITRERLREYHARFFGATFGTLGAVGDFNGDSLQAWASGTFGTWASPTQFVRFARRNFEVQASREDLPLPAPRNAVVIAGLQVPLRNLDRELIALEIVNIVFGGDFRPNRLDSRLRLQARVVVAQSTSLLSEARDAATVFEYAALVPRDSVVRAESMFLEELRKLATEGLTAEELRAGREEWLRVHRGYFRAYNQIAHYLAVEGREGRSMQEWAESFRAAESLTREEVNAAAARYLVPQRLVAVRAGAPEDAARPASPVTLAPPPAPAPSTPAAATPNSKTGVGGARPAQPVPARPAPAPPRTAPVPKDRRP